MKYLFLLVASFLYISSYSQLAFSNIGVDNTNDIRSKIFREEGIKKESVYLFKKKKNKDSVLLLTEYYDSSGNLIERDDFNPNGRSFRITNYSYNGHFLVKEESMSESTLIINGSNIYRNVKTYSYDSATNTVIVKEFSFFGDSLKHASINKTKKEYDNLGYLNRVYNYLPNGESYLYLDYTYINGILTEIRAYDLFQKLQFSYLYEYDENTKTKKVYKLTYTKSLVQEYFYDDQKKLIMDKDYELGHIFLDHTTSTYSYNSIGLLESKTLQNLHGDYIYYKYYYSK